jgi:hypothetical protein
MLRNFLLFFLPLALVAAFIIPGYGQGVTTAAMNGIVTDMASEPLLGASVVAVHTPTGTQYGTVTGPNGRFNFQNMRVGGPYTVTVSYVGFEQAQETGISLALGENRNLVFILTEENVTLSEVVVTGRADQVMNQGRTGAETNVTREQLQSLPTINRSLQDFTRLTPQASTDGAGTSFAGTSGRFNNISIDGAVNNDVFGLGGTGGTPGGQTGTQPISLDAIDQIQVVIAPYDVRQGSFTGGGINAVTRSGTNDFSGSAYFFGRNENFAGRTPTFGLGNAERTRLNEFVDYQTGFRLGGPIVKNKLFFFINGEITRRQEPVLFTPGTPTTTITLEEVQRVDRVLREMGYDPGGFGEFINTNKSNKLFARLDYNISNNHHLTLRHNYVRGVSSEVSRGQNSFTFANGGIFFPSTTNSTVAELKSNIGNQFSNNLILNYTTIRDDRDPMGEPFPRISIDLGSRRTINAGSENFSVANRLFQDIISLTDNFTGFYGRHAVTLGTHNEFFKFENLFIRDNYGTYNFRAGSGPGAPTGLENFENWRNVRPSNYSLSYSLVPGAPQFAPTFRAMQLGFYLQDEFTVTNQFKLTGGLRADIPVFLDRPTANPAFNNNPNFAQYDVATDQVPRSRILWSPRLGFNWDVTGERTTQLRGGVGVFTGRVPFVWISNQYNNTGIEFARFASSNLPADFRFRPDPFNQPTAADFGLPAATSEINVTARNFRFPQTFRANVAVDQRLFWGLIGTLEGIYSKVLSNINYRDLNLAPATTTLQGADNRPLYPGTGTARTSIDPSYTNVILLENTSRGYAYNLTAQLQRPFENGFNANIAYTFGESKDVNPTTSSQAISNWRFTPNVRGANNPELAYANFDIRHRIIGSISYRKEYLKNLATTISVFYTGRSGAGISYIYRNDINREDLFSNTANDLIYVPANASEIVFVPNPRTQGQDPVSPEQQWQEFNAFIESDDYLRSRRGQYAERNAGRTPFQHQFDMRIIQDVFANIGAKRHTLQVTLDVFNIGNLINASWGRQYFNNFNNYQLLNFVGFQQGTNIPTFRFDPVPNNLPYNINQISSRWQAQLGLRYIF